MPVEISGKQYTTVAERLKIAREEAGIEQVVTAVEQVGDTMVVRAMVRLKDGKEFTGHSLVKTNSRSPAERDAPLETAETSAVGRALAFAGWHGSDEGLAGAEEIQLAQSRASQRVIQPPQPQFFPDESSSFTRVSSGAAPRPVGGQADGPRGSAASPAQVRFASKLWGDAGRPLPPPKFETMTGSEISRLIDDLKAEAAR